MRAAAAAAMIVVAIVASCGERPRDSNGSDSTGIRDSAIVDTSARLTEDLPAGRFQLPTSATPAPDLWISLPDGYRVKGASDKKEDRFYIVDTDDPSLTDKSAVTPGFMLLYVGGTKQNPFEDGKATGGERVMVLGQPLQWRVAEDSAPDASPYFQRDLGSADIFGRLSPELSRTPLHLHIYVAGSDSARVAELMRSAESINIVP